MTGDMGEPFGDYLRARILSKGWTQNEAAAHVGVSSGVMSSWITGARVPKVENLERLADLLGIPLDEMLVRAGRRRRRDTDLDPKRAEAIRQAGDLPYEELDAVLDFMAWRRESRTRRLRAERTQRRRADD